MKVSIIIAAYNEAPTIAVLLERVWSQPIPAAFKEIIVIESNSTDGTRERVAAFAESRPTEAARRVHVILEPAPRGKGHAVRQGLAAACGDVILIQDGDLEYDVRDYPELLAPIAEGRTAFVLGSRHMGTERWKIRKFGRRGLQSAFMNIGGVLFHAFFNWVFSVKLSDPTTMFKVFRSECLEGLELTCNRFDFDYELLGKLIRAGYPPLEVPVSYCSRGFDQGKKIRIFRDPFTWVAAILKCRFAVLYRARPPAPAAVAPARK